MMQILCVAVVLLSLTSVCQPAPLACEKLLKPVDNAPDLSGRWYMIAGSLDSCLVATLLNSALYPSLKLDITSKDTPNIYNVNITAKIYGYCESESDDYLYANNSLFDVDKNNAPTGKPSLLLQTSCPDCMVLKSVEDDWVNTFLLISRRQSVTDAELKEFESQVKCIGWSKMQVFNTDHDYENCKSFDEGDTDASVLSNLVYQRLKTTYMEVVSCLLGDIVSNPKSTIEMIQGLFT